MVPWEDLIHDDRPTHPCQACLAANVCEKVSWQRPWSGSWFWCEGWRRVGWRRVHAWRLSWRWWPWSFGSHCSAGRTPFLSLEMRREGMRQAETLAKFETDCQGRDWTRSRAHVTQGGRCAGKRAHRLFAVCRHFSARTACPRILMSPFWLAICTSRCTRFSPFSCRFSTTFALRMGWSPRCVIATNRTPKLRSAS